VVSGLVVTLTLDGGPSEDDLEVVTLPLLAPGLLMVKDEEMGGILS